MHGIATFDGFATSWLTMPASLPPPAPTTPNISRPIEVLLRRQVGRGVNLVEHEAPCAGSRLFYWRCLSHRCAARVFFSRTAVCFQKNRRSRSPCNISSCACVSRACTETRLSAWSMIPSPHSRSRHVFCAVVEPSRLMQLHTDSCLFVCNARGQASLRGSNCSFVGHLKRLHACMQPQVVSITRCKTHAVRRSCLPR